MNAQAIANLSDFEFYCRPDVISRRNINAAQPPMSKPVDEKLQRQDIESANWRFQVWESIYTRDILDWVQNSVQKLSDKSHRERLLDRVWYFLRAGDPLKWTMETRREALLHLHYTIYYTFQLLQERVFGEAAMPNQVGLFPFLHTDTQKIEEFRRVLVTFSKILMHQTSYVRDLWAPLVKLHMDLSINELANSAHYENWDVSKECSPDVLEQPDMAQVESALRRMNQAVSPQLRQTSTKAH